MGSLVSLQKMTAMDLALCHRFNRACRYAPVRRFFAVVSWLGDGKFWYALMLGLPAVQGRAGLEVSLRMAAAGVVGVIVYKLIKQGTHRPRPFMAHASIVLGADPLDPYSFPSGHTLHAVSFSLIVCSAFPLLAWILAPFTLLVATSRLVLGLHYPTDVALGALLGAALALAALLLPLS